MAETVEICPMGFKLAHYEMLEGAKTAAIALAAFGFM